MVDYEAEVKTTKKVLYITRVEQPQPEGTVFPSGAEGYHLPNEMRIELKPDIEEYDITIAVEHLAEIAGTPLSYRLAEEADIEVKVKGGKRK